MEERKKYVVLNVSVSKKFEDPDSGINLSIWGDIAADYPKKNTDRVDEAIRLGILREADSTDEIELNTTSLSSVRGYPKFIERSIENDIDFIERSENLDVLKKMLAEERMRTKDEKLMREDVIAHLEEKIEDLVRRRGGVTDASFIEEEEDEPPSTDEKGKVGSDEVSSDDVGG